MSRIGKNPVEVPKGVDVKVDGQSIKVKGPKGELTRALHPSVVAVVEGGKILLKTKTESKLEKPFHGLSRTLVANMVTGVTQGFTKSLTLVGVGYRAAMQGKELNLTLGYSHPVKFNPPAGITIAVDKQTTVIVTGSDKETVGQVAANIRGFRPPEPYHGKGVRYSDEQIITKVGKAGGK
jgi:large subunit ribosomal protein L6